MIFSSFYNDATWQFFLLMPPLLKKSLLPFFLFLHRREDPVALVL